MVESVTNKAMQNMLHEMQAMQQAATTHSPVGVNKINQQSDFSSFLSQAISAVNRDQITAESLQTRHELGDKDADLVSVMLATQKANVSFQTLMQVRNRMLNAYREVMNMPM